MQRRDFLMASAAGVAAASLGGKVFATPPAALHTFDEGDMKYRMLGETGERVSLIGLGGYHLGTRALSDDESIRLVRSAVDRGVNFCDNCWDYNNGQSEIRLGKALRDGYRAKVFLMTKIDGRTRESAASQIDTSLKRLQTDRIDLIQFHEIIRMEDPERIFAPGGAMEGVLAARNLGKVRYIGFTGHKSPAIHRKMFEVAAAHGVHFDTVQMPVNIMDAHYDSFQSTIFPIAQREKTAVLAMKTFGDHFILDAKIAEPIEMLHYSMSQPVAVVITGCDSFKILDQALEAVRTYQPMSTEQQQALLAKSATLAKDGSTELYKVTTSFDGTVQNPQWLIEL
jgi:aryl-alcohol dehydrogenase-like predicted oxidoreductase